MEIASTTATPTQVQTEVLKKAQDVQVMQGQQDLKVMESAAKESQEMTAQKTGMGGSLNITG